MNENLYDEMVGIMLKVQQSTATHQKYRYTLFNVFKQNNAEFYDCFEKIITMILLDGNKRDTIYTERCMNFCTSFCALTEMIDYCEKNSLELLYEQILYFLLDVHNLEADIIRFRACKIISKLLTELVDVDLDEDLFDSLREIMVEHLNDSKSDIRLQVVNVVFRMQDPTNNDCEVITKLLTRMNKDLIPKVRKACVEKIAITKKVLNALLKRIRDVNVDVRIAAFNRLCGLVKYLQVEQRQKVIKNGICDKSERVNLFVRNQLLEAWLKEYNYNYLEFLQKLRLDSSYEYIQNSVKIVDYVLNSLFRTRSGEEIFQVLKLTSELVLSYEDLNWESSIYWRILVNTCRKSQTLESFLDHLLPDLVVFVQYINRFCLLNVENHENNKEFQFILKQLFIITFEHDLTDTASRQALNQLVNQVLCNYNLDEDVVEIVVQNLERSILKDESREKFLLEILSTISYDMDVEELGFDAKGKIMELKLRVSDLKVNQEKALSTENYLLADQIEKEINNIVFEINNLSQSLMEVKTVEKKSDSHTLLKCLKIARAYLKSPKLTSISPNFRPMCDEIIEMLINFDHGVRVKALECYVLCCIADKSLASKAVNIFYGIVMSNLDEENYDVDSVLISIKGLTDMVLLYGPDIISESSSETNESAIFSFTKMIQLLVNLMDEESIAIQECAGLALCKIIIIRRIFSPNLIARMVLKWCNPSSEDEESQMLRQTIGLMLEEIPKILNSSEQIEDAFFITLNTLLNAPQTSSLSQVNIQDISKFMLNMCTFCQSNLTLTHKNIALKIICNIRDDHDNEFNFIYSKILLQLDSSSWDDSTCYEMEILCNETAELTESRISSMLNKFKRQLLKFKEKEE